jgi:hypothetical protein
MELKTALQGFAQEFGDYHAEITRKLSQQEERLTMLDRKTALSPSRPVLSQADAGSALHHKAFDAYLRRGDDTPLRGLELEAKGLNTQMAADGGYLVDPETASAIRGVLHATASIRAIASVVTVEAGTFDVLVDHTDVSTGWASETAALAESDTPKIDRIPIRLHELAAMPKASQRLLDDSAFDIEGWLASRIAAKFARAEAAAFILGDGLDKPRGFLTHDTVEDGGWEWGNLGYIATGAEGDFAPINASDATQMRTMLTTALGISLSSLAAASAPTATVASIGSPTFTNVTATTARLGATITSDGGEPVLERGVVVLAGDAGTPDVEDPAAITIQSAGGVGTFTVDVTGLAPATAYRFRAFVRTSLGIVYSEVGSFTTSSVG